jgi:nucleoid DNA-binding protein
MRRLIVSPDFISRNIRSQFTREQVFAGCSSSSSREETERQRPTKALEITMPNTTKKTIVVAIVEKTVVKPTEAKRALEAILQTLKLALASGRTVDLGKRLGKLKVVRRNPSRRVNRNLKYRVSFVEDVHKKHPKTVRLLGGKDLSPNPLPTIVHKKEEPQPVPARSRHFRVAVPSWRRRFR